MTRNGREVSPEPKTRELTSTFVPVVLSRGTVRRLRRSVTVCSEKHERGDQVRQGVARLASPFFSVGRAEGNGATKAAGPGGGGGDDGGAEDLDKKRRDVVRILQLFWRLSLPYWKEEKGAKWKLAGVGALTLLQSGISVAFSYVGRDFWNALSAKDADKFMHQSALFVVALVIATPTVVLYSYSRDLLGLQWRDWLTKKTLTEYFRERNYYGIENSSEVDNPDQRIADDLRAFTRTSLQFILGLLISAIDLVSFSTILWSIYPQLFLVLIVYSATGTALTGVIGKRLVTLNFSQLQTEADFRYSLVRLRENAESVAFYRGEEREQTTVEGRFDQAVDNYGNLLKGERNLGLFTTGYRYLIQVLPALAVSPLYFRGAIELGVVNQSYAAFNHILNDLSLIVNQFEALSQFTAGVDRLGEFAEFLERRAKQLTTGLEDNGAIINLRMIPESRVEAHDLCLVTPDSTHRLLLQNINFSVEKGQRLLVVGPSGAGKSSLLRAVAGLWRDGSGEILRTEDEQVLFVPQKPYCTLGSLREQLTYPTRPTDVGLSDEELQDILVRVDLASLVERFGGLDTVRDWSDVLSLGEQQRLSFGRLLVKRPALVILDEASSALDLSSEARLYKFLQETGATVLSVGHRPSLLRYHDQKLRIDENGTCKLERISEEEAMAVTKVSFL